jgi:PilZ domain-containing protein
MTADENHLERRASQRFDFQLPISVRLAGTDCESFGFTQDLSGRGVFFYTDLHVKEGDAVELTLVMPSEITLTENARVRCRARVIRVTPVEQKFGVAARIEGYEYLPKEESAAQVSANFPRISTVHNITQPARDPAASISVASSPGTSSPVISTSGSSISGTQASGTQASGTSAPEVSSLPASTLGQPEGDRVGNR